MKKQFFRCSELVLIAAVILVTGVLVLPALAKARAEAQQALCLNNLGKIGQGWGMYLADNNNTYQNRQLAVDGYAKCWAGVIYTNYLPDGMLWKCPEALEYEELMFKTAGGDVTDIGNGVNVASLQYGYYGYNSTGFDGVKADTVKNPAGKILIGDVAKVKEPNNVDSAPDYTKLTWASLYSISASDAMPDARHNGSAVIGWADGHVSEESAAIKKFSTQNAAGQSIGLDTARNTWWLAQK